MDPLSLAASVIAVANLAASICTAISDLRALSKSLPGRLHAVNNEVADLELVLSQVALLIEERAILLESTDSAIPHLLKQARVKLNELESIVHHLTVTYVTSKVPLLGAHTWRKEQGRLKSLQDDIRVVKSSLNIMLGASNSQDMTRIRLDIQEISAVTAQSSQHYLALNEKFVATLVGVDERIARVEEMLRAQSQQLQDNQFAQVRSSYSTPTRPLPYNASTSPRKRTLPSKNDRITSPPRVEDGIGVRVTPYVLSCRAVCPCSCHSQHRSSTPAILNRFLGRLFVGYAGLPVLSPKCDKEECQGSRARQVSMEYWFPLGFWSTILRMQVGYHPNAGPTLQLETLRRIPDSAQCVDFALKGNIEGLKHLFGHGLASPRDVSTSRGYSLLRWALYGKQYETCEFLVRAGADPSYRPISTSDNSPRIKACHFLLEGGLSDTAVSALRTITRGSDYLDDFIDDSKFTKAHKIVLGISMQHLEDELLLNPGDIDIQDAMGRTPLAWAAAKGDRQSVVTLLSYGADPNITDVQLSGPLSNAAAQGHTVCVQLLLEAGADPDPPLPKGVKKGSPLNVASRNTKDPLLLKRLLDFGADVDQCSTDGKTALFHAARNDNASFAILLLEYGASINAASATGETPLTTTITYNSHNVLRLFLDRWQEYSVCPRLNGPHLLERVALYADHETLKILGATDHLKLKYDKQYTLRDFGTTIRQRLDMTEKLALAFDELLTIINTMPDPRQGEEDLLESGFFSCLTSRANTFEEGLVREAESDDDSNDNFQDALNHLQIAAG